MNIARLLARAGRAYPDKPALYLGTDLVADYATFARRAASAGRGLGEMFGFAPGARAALLMTNAPEYLELLYAIWYAGGAAAPLNPRLHPREVAGIVADLEPDLVFVSPDLAGPLAGHLPGGPCRILTVDDALLDRLRAAAPLAAPVAREGDDLAWLFYTSGTTGPPKGAMLSHRNLLAMTTGFFSDVEPVRHDDVIAHAAPLSHAAGLWSFAFVLAGAAQIVPRSRGFDPAELVALGRAHGPLSMFAVPTMVNRLVAHVKESGADPDGFRTILYAGGPMYLEDLEEAIAVMGDRFVQIYGQGETPMTISALPRHVLRDRGHPRHAARAASVGMPHSIVDVRTVGPDGTELPPGEPGEVVVRGDTVMLGYWRNPAATAEALRGGWLRTGDVGIFDEDGFLTLHDRIRDLIISGGSNIYPREVEEVLLQHPAVCEAAVVGRRNEEWGEEVVAFIVAAGGEGPAPAELDRFCLERIAAYKRPRAYRFVAELPKSGYGKVLKSELRKVVSSELPDRASRGGRRG